MPGPQISADQVERTALFRSVPDGRRVLNVLDNARSFSQIRPLLPGTPRCCVLVTSRGSMGGQRHGRRLRPRAPPARRPGPPHPVSSHPTSRLSRTAWAVTFGS
ncbi:hypothetical protein GCM10009535_09560 [Streptomyces thermocarboxydovorans]|uniref:Uncharacterized protein n=1 Tax=Streptomyces thermocarboxydovorans TaxID=59298 RepID=A0ABP3SH49_9ACTN